MNRLRLLAAAIWTGSLVGGAAVATMLFANLERAAAGSAAALLFRTEGYIAMACAAIILLARPTRREGWLAVAMLACALVILVGIAPMMAELRAVAGAEGMADPAVRARFGWLHGASTLFYAVEALLGIKLVLVRRERDGAI